MPRTADGYGWNPPPTAAIHAARTVCAERIASLRETAGLSQRSAAARAGLDASHWSKIERQIAEPTLSSLLRIQYALELESLEELFGEHPSARLVRSPSRANGPVDKRGNAPAKPL